MPNPILDGLSLVDSTGRIILAATVSTLLAGVAAHGFLRARYAALERDLEENGDPRPHFSHRVLTRIARKSEAAYRRSGTALMVRIETYIDRFLPEPSLVRREEPTSLAAFGESVARLEGAVTRFESALRHFAASTRDLWEVHLVVALKPSDGR